MKSYLDLIPVSAKVRRQQNQLTLLCIIFSVFLVTAVFSMAEMGVRMEQKRLLEKHGSLSFSNFLDSSMVQTLLPVAVLLFFLILLAGVLMIAGSMNSRVAQRTKFFGMMRCIGMSRRQIIRFVRLEALCWCKTAIPAGLALGIAATWGLCAVLRFLVGEEFSDIPLFGVSLTGIAAGVIMGISAVLLASKAPAKRASRVSPIAAVSTENEAAKKIRRPICARLCKVETSLGIHHAVSDKKNLVLLTSSFGLSILLFLCFSVLIDFAGYLLPQSSSAPDLEIADSGSSNSIDPGLPAKLREMDGVEQVFGRRSRLDIPAKPVPIDMVSYDDYDLECLRKDRALKRGSDLSKVYGNSSCVLAVWDENLSLKLGDKIQIGGEELEIAGFLKYNPFDSSGMTDGKLTLITSSETFTRLTGITGYSLILIQTDSSITSEDVSAIRSVAGDPYLFRDRRDQSTKGTYLAFVCCVYGFLFIIACVTVLNIINSISMNISARLKQYGMMRAVGMSHRQILKMTAAEAFTYAILGCAAGCILGLVLHRLLYGVLIAGHFAYASYCLPAGPLAIILFFLLLSVCAAVYVPCRQLRNLSVTETIGSL